MDHRLPKKRERPPNEGDAESQDSAPKRAKLSDPALLWQGYVGADTEMNVHTLKRQNREIFAKLKEQYARLKEFEQDRTTAEEREHRSLMQLRAASQVLAQFVENIKALVTRIAPTESTATTANSPSPLLKALLDTLAPTGEAHTPNGSTPAQPESESPFKLFTEPAQAAITQLAAAVEAARAQGQIISAALAAGPVSDAVLQGELARKTAEMQALHAQNAQLVEQDRQHSSQMATVQSQLQAAESRHSALSKRFTTLQDSHYTLQRSAERMRIELTSMGGSKDKPESNGATPAAPTPAATNGDAMNVDTTATPGPSSEELDALKQEKEEYRIQAQQRQANVDRLLQDKQDLLTQIQQLEDKISQSAPSTGASAQEVAQAEKARQTAEAGLQRANDQIQELQRQVDDLQRHKSFKQDQYIDQLNGQIGSIQKDRDDLLRRLRNADDEKERLRHKVDELQKFSFDKRLIQDAQQSYVREQGHHKKLKIEYEKLKEEMEGLRGELAKFTGSESATLVEQLKDKDREIGVLAKKNDDLAKEIEEWQAKDKSWQDKVKEMDLVVKTYMSTKSVTENEFIQLKAQERALQEDTQRLQAELAQASSKTTTADQELQRQIEELQRIHKELKLQTETAQAKAEEFYRMYQSSKRESTDRLQEIEFITKECEDLQEQNSKLTTMLVEKEETNTRLVAEQIRVHQAQQLSARLKEMQSDRLAHLEAKVAAQAELVKVAQRKAQIHEEEARKATEEATTWAKLIEESKRAATNSALALDKVSIHLTAVQGELTESRHQFTKQKLDVEAEKQKNHKQAEELAQANSKLRRMTPLTKSTGGTDNVSVYQQLLAKYQCSVCHDNRVDTMLVACGHVFCRECVDKNVKSRSRKCSSCSTSFGLNDVKTMYFA